jgi:hypothetical protein
LLNFDLFHDRSFGGFGIAQSWIEKAHREPDGWTPSRQFDRFLALWMAFNAWGMCVTLAKTDAAMIRALSRDDDVAEVFYRLLATGRFDEGMHRVAPSFPLPSFSDLLRLNPQYDWRGPRDDAYWAQIGRANAAGKRVRLSPRLNPEEPKWGDVLECTYKVRCNLMHGGKMANDAENEFVGFFADVLEELMVGTRSPTLFQLSRGRP